ncbi:MAG: hypothetical protein QM610_15685 [Chitinophagaceae bacterium]
MKKPIFSALLLLGVAFSASAESSTQSSITSSSIAINTSCGGSFSVDSGDFSDIYELLATALVLENLDCGSDISGDWDVYVY